jgi:uncharacterized repeat protein (TIGR01451 family)
MAGLDARGALLPRDIDGDGFVDAYYDTAQNITWLRDWGASGQLTWPQAVAWAAALNVGGVTGWRLPNISDKGNAGCDFSTAGGTDCGYNVDSTTSEMARLWYVTLGNLAFCAVGDANCNLQGSGQPGWGLTNTGPFKNMQSSTYWSGTPYAPDVTSAWNFSTEDGSQDSDAKAQLFYAVAVHAGDVAPAPVGYTVTDLTPPGFFAAYVSGVGAGQQAGAGSGPATGNSNHAIFWTGSPGSAVDLHPPSFDSSFANSAAGKQQVGGGDDVNFSSRALLWRGTAASVIDLTPVGFDEALGLGTDGRHQVGIGWIPPLDTSHALLWSGSAASVVDLHPAGYTSSGALGVADGQQVGNGMFATDGHAHALLWMGSAASVLDLHPTGFTNSYAYGVAGGQQVGYGDGHALLWTGTAASAVDLHPSGFMYSQAYAVAGGQQAGTAFDGATHHPMVWTGSADTAVDLQRFLPADLPDGNPSGIDDAGNVVGSAGDHAVMWVPALPYHLDIAKTGAPDKVPVGGQITYTITVANNLTGTATGVTLIDLLRSGLTLVSATPSQGSCAGSVKVTCNLGSLQGGSSATVTIVVSTTQAGDVSNTASVSADNLVNNSATVLTTVNPSADLSITKTDSPDPAKTGSNLSYTITVKNAGPTAATGVTVTDALPAGVNFVSAVAAQGNCSGTTTITCNLGTVLSGAATKITIVVIPTQAGSLTNTATVVANEPDPDTSNNTATQNTTVNATPMADLTGNWVSAAQKCATRRGKTTCTVSGNFNVVNLGTAAAKASVMRFYLSSDSNFSPDDLQVGQAKVVSLPPGQHTKVAVKLTVPGSGNASGKYVIAVLDAGNVVVEASEANNFVPTAQFP